VARCDAFPDELDNVGGPRFREYHEGLVFAYGHDRTTLWDVFGVVRDVQVCVV
jgi:hypothetical protein